MITSKVFDRLDLSADFWKQFDVQNKKLKKQVGLFEIENIDKPNVITIALNPKEYYERFNDHSDNKNIEDYINQLEAWILIHILKDCLI